MAAGWAVAMEVGAVMGQADEGCTPGVERPQDGRSLGTPPHTLWPHTRERNKRLWLEAPFLGVSVIVAELRTRLMYTRGRTRSRFQDSGFCT